MRPTVDINLDKPRKLRYGYEAIAYIEDKIGKPIGQVDFGNLFVKESAAIIAGGLIHETPDITPSDVLKILDEYEIDTEELGQKMQEAILLGVKTGKK